MVFHFWLRHPHKVLARVRYWWWERRNPDKPWLTPGAVAFLETHLRPEMIGLEFGSGRSTVWYARKLRHLTSVEHHAGWAETVKGQLAGAGITNVDYRAIPLDHPETDGEQPAYDPLPRYVAVASEFADGALDFVVVDGHYRSHCIRTVGDKLRPGGLLLVDDANMWPANAPPVPPEWLEVSRTTNDLKFTVIWRKPA